MSSNLKLRIEKDIPLPGVPEIPFQEMEVGDSVLVHTKKLSDVWLISKRIYRYQKQTGKKFSMRKVNDLERRIYRIK